MMRWLTPVLALGLVVALTNVSRADDAKATGSISGTVTGTDGKAAANVQVRVVQPKKDAAKTGDKPAAPTAADSGTGKAKGAGHKEATATGTTDNDGKFKLDNVPVGDYMVVAIEKGVGMGHEKATVKAGETTTVSITLKAAKAGGKKAAKTGDTAAQ